MPEMTAVERAFCQSAPWRAFTRRVVLPWALQGERPAGDGLEIGGGSGAMAAALLRSFPGLRLTVTDYDDAMVTPARERLHPFGDRAEVRRADASSLPFADDSFDAVFSFIMLHHVIAWEQAIAEAIRVLRTGGLLVGYDLLANRLSRGVHQAEGAHHRMLELGALERELAQLPTADVQLRRGLGGLVVRFRVRKR